MTDAGERRAPVVRAVIVDDEMAARRGLRLVLRGRSDVDIVGECRTGNEAVALIRRLQPDLVLLDIQMPGLDGFGVVREIGARAMPCVVFVTAFDEFALRAFEVAAVDYVVKPYTDDRLIQAVERALARLREQRVTAAHERLLDALDRHASTGSGAGYATRLLVSVGTQSIIVALSEVTLLQADGYCVRISAPGSRYTLRESMQELEARLDPAEFLRVHRSTIVRIAAVKSVDRVRHERLFLTLADGTRVLVSRARREWVLRALGEIRG